MKSYLAFCILNIDCPLKRMLYKAINGEEKSSHVSSLRLGNSNGGSTDSMRTGRNGDGVGEVELFPLAARMLYNTCSNSLDDESEIWIRVSGKARYVKELEQVAGRTPGVRYQVVYQSKFNEVIRFLWHKSICSEKGSCPIALKPRGVMIKSTVILPDSILLEVIVARSSAFKYLKSLGCRFVRVIELSEMDYMLTEKQEEALIRAYSSGYYRFPRGVTLKELARSMGLSTSSLAELLRKAEIKVVEAFIRHELPHYMVYAVLRNSARRREDTSASAARRNVVEVEEKSSQR